MKFFFSLPALQRDLSGPVSQFTRNSIAMTEMAESSSAVGSTGSGITSPKVKKIIIEKPMKKSKLVTGADWGAGSRWNVPGFESQRPYKPFAY